MTSPLATAADGDSAPESELVSALARAAYLVTAVLSSVGAEAQLSLTQVRVLGILRDRTLRMTELADYLGLERSTLSGLIARAEVRGLIARAPSPADRRVVEVQLTAAGRRLAAQGDARIASGLAEATARLTPAERVHLTALLERLLATPI